jgi:peptide/nickel transport system substrate-binding protein
MDPKWNKVIAVIVVVILALAGIGVYYEVQARSSASASCALQSTDPIEVDQAETVATADPQWAASTPGWGMVQQIYQTLVMYNQSSLTTFTGVLAQNWSTSGDGYHWNFTLRSGVHFSNGDPFNAYVMWYSLNRLLAMEGINQYLLSENFWFPGVSYYSPAAQVASALANVTTDLNTFNFTAPTAPELAVMEAGNQSFQVLAPNEIELNLGYGYNAVYNATTGNYTGVPYSYLLAEMSTPGAAAVDPVVIDKNGGVTNGPNSWMASNAMGTGPYTLSSFSQIVGYTLTPNPDYWATSAAAAEPWNNNLQPAKATIDVIYQEDPSATVEDLKTGAVASASFAYLGPSTISELQGLPCVTVQNLNAKSIAFSGAGGSWWVFMNQSVFPFNNWSVRAAITHAIDYQEVIQDAFGGYAFEWVGPVAPGHPYYNPANLAPYPYNLTLAKQEIADSPCANNACAGMDFNYEYLSTSVDWQDAATVIQDDLGEIGITINPVGVTLDQFYNEQTIDPNTGKCTSAETVAGLGPFYIGQDFYSSDYISPDDWTQNDFLSYGSANICNSGFNNGAEANYNASLDNLVLEAAGSSNATFLTQAYAEMTEIMYQNYTNAWFAVPDLFAVYSPLLQGWQSDQTPMGSTEVDTMGWNTAYIS